ncbi:MAG TPA: S8 family serine peptidase [Chitinivibrionales bacterium]|nr:S8 family serine peptidase [Chitinivibrionales bacterium]
MIYRTCLLIICFMILASFNPAFCRNFGPYLGTFELQKHPKYPTKENLRAAVQDVQKSGCKKTIRVAALVDASFSESGLTAAGWRLISRIGDVITLEGCESTAPYLTAVDGILFVDNRTKFYPTMDSARNQAHINEVQGRAPNYLTKHFTGKGVLIGFLDTGFEPHHPDFLDSLGHTRFIAMWDQTDTSGIPPKPYGYGLVKMQKEIDQDTLFGTQESGHGTIVASCGAGSDTTHPFWGAAPQAGIIAVKYGNSVANFIDGLKWVFSIADSLAMPCVVNMSIGIQEGPHDGTSLMDQTIDQLSGAGHIIVGAAGNDGNLKAHIKFTLPAGGAGGTWVWPEIIIDSLSPTDVHHYAYSYADIWGEPNKAFTDTIYFIDLTTMAYKKSGRVLTTSVNFQSIDTVLYPNSATGPDTMIFYTYVERRNAANLKPHIEVAMYANGMNLVPGVRLASTTVQTIHAWNCYKQNFSGLSLPGFSDGDTITTIDEVGGTAKTIISVGSYFSKTVQPLYDGTVTGIGDTTLYQWAPWSSIGPTVDGRVKPEICAGGRIITGAMSSQAEETGRTAVWPDHSNTRGRYGWTQGTSVSAPIVAGIIALMLEADKTLTPQTVVQTLQNTATKDKYTGNITTPDVRWGAGKVNALAAIESMGIPVMSTRLGAASMVTARTILLVLSGGDMLSLAGPGVKDAKEIFVDVFDLRGRLCASLPMQPGRAVVVPQIIAKGCFVAKARWKGGKGIEQVFTRF